ncbi:hypothetical protein MNL76_09425 [Fervidobacterium riparium]|uniref:hypothetical protein n=1 Tax=Fervidobacterium gondwanense TaxID=44754 RepID=UPI003C716F32
MQKRSILFSIIFATNSVANTIFTIGYAIIVSRSFYAPIVGGVMANILTLAIVLFISYDIRKFSKVMFSNVIKHLRYGLPFIPSALLFWFFSSIDKISLRQYSTFYEIGFTLQHSKLLE